MSWSDFPKNKQASYIPQPSEKMGNVNSIPIVSQTKSLVQYGAGDSKGAKRTQEEFLTGCPVFSQVASAVDYAKGRKDNAWERQKEFLRGVEKLVDAAPAVGHVKGAVHYAMGNKEHGDQCMKSASRTTGVMTGGVCGFFAAGPVGAVVGGLAGGQALDGATTAVDSAIHNEYRPNGSWYQWDRVVNRKADVGEVFDLTVGHVADGVVGYASGSTLGPEIKNIIDNRLNVGEQINKGGSYKSLRSKYSEAGKVEANHLPAKASYKGTKFENIGKGNKAPAVSTAHIDHQMAGTTGAGAKAQVNQAAVSELMKKGDMAGAIKKSIEVDYGVNKKIAQYSKGIRENIDCHQSLNTISASEAVSLKAFVNEKAAMEMGRGAGNPRFSVLYQKPNKSHED